MTVSVIRGGERSLDAWVEPVSEALDELANKLGLGERGPCLPRSSMPSGLSGAHITLSSEDSSTRIAILAGASGVQALARALFMNMPTPKLVLDDITDAVCELANILGGLIKVKLGPDGNALATSLPVFFHGNISPHLGDSWLCFETSLADTRVTVMVIGGWPPMRTPAASG